MNFCWRDVVAHVFTIRTFNMNHHVVLPEGDGCASDSRQNCAPYRSASRAEEHTPLARRSDSSRALASNRESDPRDHRSSALRHGPEGHLQRYRPHKGRAVTVVTPPCSRLLGRAESRDYCWRTTWSPSFRPLAISVTDPLERPTLTATLRWPSFWWLSGTKTEAFFWPS